MTLPLQLQLSSASSTPISSNTRGVARVAEHYLKQSSTKSGETKACYYYYYYSVSPHNQQASSQLPVQLLLPAARSNHSPQTP